MEAEARIELANDGFQHRDRRTLGQQPETELPGVPDRGVGRVDAIAGAEGLGSGNGGFPQDGGEFVADRDLQFDGLSLAKLGAGGGGFLLFFVPPDRKQSVKTALADIRSIPFEMEPQGSKIIYMT